MENGPFTKTVWVTVFIITSTLDFIIANKYSEDESGFCSKENFRFVQCVHTLAKDPSPEALDPLWDTFPCPPPWKPELILNLGWDQRLASDGQRLLSRVAGRCGLDLLSLRSLASQEKEDVIFKDCDINCFLLLLAAFICGISLVVASVAFFIRRRSLARWKNKKTSASPTSGANYHPVPSENRGTEVVLANGRVATRLEGDTDFVNGFQNPKYYGKFYDSQLSRACNVYGGEEGSRQVKNSGEEGSLSYSGTDTTHTYESIRGSVHSGSFRFSDAFPKYLIESPITGTQDIVDNNFVPTESVHLQSQFYSTERRSNQNGTGSVVSYSRSQCSCPRCTQMALQQNMYPNPPVQCRCGRCSQLSMYQSSGTGYGSDGYTDYGVYNRTAMALRPVSGGLSDTEGVRSKRRRHHSESGYVEDDVDYLEDFEESSKTREGSSSSRPVFLPSTSAFYPTAPKKKCNCKRCSQNRHEISNGISLDHQEPFYEAPKSAQSEFYGVPERTYPVQYLSESRPQRCSCKRCSQNSINITENFEIREFSASPGPKESQIEPSTVFINSKTEHRKRKRNKMNRPTSLNTSSDETNTGSEKSFRSVPKTNGSLLNARFVNR